MSAERTAASMSPATRARAASPAMDCATSARRATTRISSIRSMAPSRRTCSRAWTPPPITVAIFRVGACHRVDRQHRGTGGADGGDQRRIHDGERRAGIAIEQADETHVARQVDVVIAFEHVHGLERDVPPWHPCQHGETETLAGNVDLGPRRRLDLTGAQRLEAGGERGQRGGRIEDLRHIGRSRGSGSQSRPRPLAHL